MEEEKKESALTEREGVDSTEIINPNASSHAFSRGGNNPETADLIAGIRKADITALSRAITLVESTNATHYRKASEVVNACLLHAKKSIRIGITGVPGVGKSTFIEAFGKYLTGIGKKVAVLAVDPSSSLSRGSILGDKTRMEELVKDPNAYIRPSASGETLGGVARKTRESITLCEAAGFDVVIVETVGVGQSETAVHGMADFFLLLQIPGAGDELQGIKRGIMEMADTIVINKAEGDNLPRARFAKTEISRALHLFPPNKSGWQPKVLMASALEKEGIEEVWKVVEEYIALTLANGHFESRRREQNQYWMMETIDEQLSARFYMDPKISGMIEEKRLAVINNELSPFAAAIDLLESYFGNDQSS